MHAVLLFKTCICLYLSWSVYVCVCVFLYFQYRVNMSLQIAKRLGHYSSFKHSLNILLKEESVPPDAFFMESKPFFKTQKVYHSVQSMLHLHTTTPPGKFLCGYNRKTAKLFQHIALFNL